LQRSGQNRLFEVRRSHSWMNCSPYRRFCPSGHCSHCWLSAGWSSSASLKKKTCFLSSLDSDSNHFLSLSRRLGFYRRN